MDGKNDRNAFNTKVKFVVDKKFTRTLKNKIKSTNISLQYNKMCILINFVTKNKTVHII